MKLAIAGFIVPYLFVYNDSLLLINTTFLEGMLVVITSIAGVTMLGIATEGYFLTKINPALRILLFGGALLLMNPIWFQDILALLVILIVGFVQWKRAKKEGGFNLPLKDYRDAI